MKPLSSEVYYLGDECRKQIASTAPAFLNQLKGLTVVDITGIDTSRTRVVATLIHGNEPSGFIASHLWLLGGQVPTTNVRILFCNPEAAQQKPIFTRRYIGDCEDLNRYFGDIKQPDETVTLRANLIKREITAVKPEAIIDLHNTSGLSPAFGVSAVDCPGVRELTGLFAPMQIYTDIRVGALMEQVFDAPIVTIECGGANEIMSHQVATDGLKTYFTLENLFERQRDVSIHRHPIRMELTGDASVGFASHRLLSTDITFIPDIEQFNRQPTPRGEFLGWYHGDDPLPLRAMDHQGIDQINNVLTVEGGRIYTCKPMQMFMATTNQEIATNDCITYLTI